MLVGRSLELAQSVVSAFFDVRRRVAAASSGNVEKTQFVGKEPVLLFVKGSYVQRCLSCGAVRVASVSSVAFGGRHMPERCSCGGALISGKSLREVVTTYSEGVLFEDADDGLYPVDARTFSQYVAPVADLYGVRAMRIAMADYCSMGGMSPANVMRAILDSPLVEWIDTQEVMVHPATLRVEDAPALNTQPYIWIEAGTYGGDGIAIHNTELDVGGFTLDEALSYLAERCAVLIGRR